MEGDPGSPQWYRELAAQSFGRRVVGKPVPQRHAHLRSQSHGARVKAIRHRRQRRHHGAAASATGSPRADRRLHRNGEEKLRDENCITLLQFDDVTARLIQRQEDRMADRPRKSTRLTVSLEDQDYDALTKIAVARDVSLSWVIRQAVRQFIEKTRDADDNMGRSVDPH